MLHDLELLVGPGPDDESLLDEGDRLVTTLWEATRALEERIRKGGCEAYISKPISVVKFLETVRNYVGKA